MKTKTGKTGRLAVGLAMLLVVVMLLPQGAQAVLAGTAVQDADTSDIAIVQETTDSDVQADKDAANSPDALADEDYASGSDVLTKTLGEGVSQADEPAPAGSSEDSSQTEATQGETGNPEYDSQTEAAQNETDGSEGSGELENSGGGYWKIMSPEPTTVNL